MTVSPFSNFPMATHSLPVVVAVDLELVRGNEEMFLNQLMPRVKQGSIALDLSNVPRMDAAGIATLITLYCTAVESGTELCVVAPSRQVLELPRLVGLESILMAGCREAASRRGGQRAFPAA